MAVYTKNKGSRRDTKKKGRGPAAPSQVVCHITSTFNNTHVTFTLPNGAKIVSASGGSVGFKNSRKSTSEAAEVAAKKAAEVVKAQGVSTVDIKLRGFGPGREGAVRGLYVVGLVVSTMQDVTGIAHNGVKKKKQARK